MSNKPSEKSEMSYVVEASELVQRVAGPGDVGDKVKAAIRRAAHRLGFGYSRTKDIWYRNARRIDAFEIDRLRERAAEVEAKQAIAGVLVVRQRLAAAGPERNRKAIDLLDGALREMGAEVGAVGLQKGL